jgi:uracil-DNA glycosylase family 4
LSSAFRNQIRDFDYDKWSQGRWPSLKDFPMQPLTALGMPPAGPNFVAEAQRLSGLSGKPSKPDVYESLLPYLTYLYYQAMYDDQFQLAINVKGRSWPSRFLLGHVWGLQADGPRPADVYVLGKNPGQEEVRQGANMVGASGQILYEALERVGIKEYPDWYVANLVRFLPPSAPGSGSGLAAPWIKDCLPILHQELRVVRPRFLLCLGNEAIAAVLGKGHNVASSAGRVYQLRYPVLDKGRWSEHETTVVPCMHSAALLHRPELTERFEENIRFFRDVYRGAQVAVSGSVEEDLERHYFDDAAKASNWVEEVLAAGHREFAIDCEWEGRFPDGLTPRAPLRDDCYLCSVQISWAPKKAVVFRLTEPGGKLRFAKEHGGFATAAKLLTRLLKGDDRTIIGHNFAADLVWLRRCLGLDFLRQQFMVPDSDPDADGVTRLLGWQKLRQRCNAFDTMLAAHAHNETADLELEALGVSIAGMPRYDLQMADWVTQRCKELKIKKKELTGYGACPDEILDPYACLHKDSRVQLGDGTWRKIADLVRERYSGTVRALLNGKVVNGRVTGWHRRSVRQRAWFKLRTASTPGGRWANFGPALTPDHEVLTQRGKVPVESLKPGVDGIATDETEFSPEQLSVFLGSLLGDGGLARKNGKRVGFGFGQCQRRAGYAAWKASVFSSHGARSGPSQPGYVRFVVPFSRYLRSLADRFPTHAHSAHAHCKAIISADLLSNLGDLGLAVWYQDDGTLVRDSDSQTPQSSRIYCRNLPVDEARLVVAWLTAKFGAGVSYNRCSGFVQISRQAFVSFHKAIRPFVHPVMAYKSIFPPGRAKTVKAGSKVFYETIEEVVPWSRKTGRGHGVRYCLTVEKAGNFLTQVGFVSNCMDADVTFRLYRIYRDTLLDADRLGECCWEPFWYSMWAAPAFAEMHDRGLGLDIEQAEKLMTKYRTAYMERLEEFRRSANWPTFNPDSPQQCCQFLFGTKYANKLDKSTGQLVSCAPPGAVCLNLTPYKTTGKRSRLWDDEIEADFRYSPSADKEALTALGGADPRVFALRDLRFIKQILKTVLKPPREDKKTGETLYDEDGSVQYDSGLLSFLCDDGRVHSQFFQTKETGRASSARPPLQNVSKRREADYKRILAGLYDDPLRSVFVAAPGNLLVEADYQGAELLIMAAQAGSKRMIDHCQRAALDSKDPRYYDIHASTCVTAFDVRGPDGRPCERTKKALEALGMGHLRDAAKPVNFGYAYGITVEAAWRRCKEAGANVTMDEVQALFNALEQDYPELRHYFEACEEQVLSKGFLTTCFGRRRRFYPAYDEKTKGEQQRQGRNFPIQSAVADAMQLAMGNLYRLRELEGDQRLGKWFWVCCQIHDALLFEVPIPWVKWLTDHVIPRAMTDMVAVWPTFLDGTPRPDPDAPYHLTVTREVGERWSTHLTAERAKQLGLTT